MKLERWWIVALLLGLLWVGSPQRTAGAPTAAVEMRVTPLLAGHVKYGEWLPLRVALSNSGADLEAEVRVEVSTTAGPAIFAAPAPLPAGARKEITLYVPPASFSRSLDVRLISGEQELKRVTVDITTHPQNDVLVGVVASRPDALTLLGGLALETRARTVVLPVKLADLPERFEPLRSLDVLIFSDVDTSSLTPAQAEALQAWVVQGGRLVLGGGSGAARVLAGLPESLRPVTLAEPVNLDALPALAALAGSELRVPGPFVATFPATSQGTPLIKEAGQALLTQMVLGKGWVLYLALDPAGSPFDAWAGTLVFWRQLLEAELRYPQGVPIDIPLSTLEGEQMGYALQNLPVLDPPSIKTLTLVLLVYIALIGPLNYLVLKRWRKLDWAWLTIPLFTVAFALGSFYVGYATRGNDVIINRISILNVTPGSTRNPVRTYVGIVSPSATTYQVQVAGSSLLSPLTPSNMMRGWAKPEVQSDPNAALSAGGLTTFDVLQSDPAVVRNLAINQWAMQSFKAEGLYQSERPPLELEVKLEGTRVTGTIRNNLDADVIQPVLVVGNSFVVLEDLPAHTSKSFDVKLSMDMSGNQFPWSLYNKKIFDWSSSNPEVSRRNQLRQSVLDAYFGTAWGTPQAPAGLLLLGWSDMSVLPVTIERLRVAPLQTTLVALTMPIPAQRGEIVLPFGTFTGRFISSQGDAGDCGPGRVYLTRGEAVLEYKLPAQARGVEIERLEIIGRPDPGITGLPAVALYDWQAQSWVKLDPLQDYVATVVPEPQRFISPVGDVLRLQASFEDWGGKGCYEFQFSLTGRAP